MNKTILIVEDELKIRRIISDFLKNDGFNIIEAENGEDALKKFDCNRVDLIILDILMPKMDGWVTCRKLRERTDTLILILSAKSEDEDKLLGYELGADDYLTKPFSPRVLVAKIKTLFKRLEAKNVIKHNIINIDGLLINELSHYVEVNGKQIDLTRKEFNLLVYLIQNKGILLHRDSILNHVWGFDYFGDTRTVDTHINRLREKLSDTGEFIHTVRGVGYKFEG